MHPIAMETCLFSCLAGLRSWFRVDFEDSQGLRTALSFMGSDFPSELHLDDGMVTPADAR